MTAIESAIREIEAAIKAVTSWTVENLPDSPDPTARAYTGTANGWRVLVVDFARPDGGRGQDGTAFKSGLIVRLTPALAKTASHAAFPDVCPECLKRGDEDLPLREECKEHKKP